MGSSLPQSQQYHAPNWVYSAIFAVILLLSPISSHAQSALDQQGLLRTGTWSLDVLAHHFQGSFCFVEGSEGAVRIEALSGSSESSGSQLAGHALDQLLWRQNDGWTVVLAGDGTGIIQPWHEGWEVVEPHLIVYLQTMLASLDYPKFKTQSHWPPEVQPLSGTGGKSQESPFRFFNSRDKSSVRLQLPPSDGQETFRQKMVGSGRGRGLDAEILKISIERKDQQNQDSIGTLVLRSSRRPGAFRLREHEAIAVHYAGQDPFIPLWPLGDLIRLP